MNLQRVLEAAKEKLLSIRFAGKPIIGEAYIVLPQIQFEIPTHEGDYLFIEITAAETDQEAVDTKNQWSYGTINFIVNVPMNTGTTRAHQVAEIINKSMDVVHSDQCYLKTKDNKVLRITGKRQNPPDRQDERYRLNVSVDYRTDD